MLLFAFLHVGSFVTCRHRDVCGTGFDLENVADAVFLDLPSPWLVIPFAKKALKDQGSDHMQCLVMTRCVN